jgi:NAD(P)-dependent dehydrogenase (short-subunit alcohol dehydrogenase family)
VRKSREPNSSSGAAKIVVVTGVSRGLGLAMAGGLANLGHTVLGCARSSDAIHGLTRKYRPPHDFQTVDVSIDSQVKSWADGLIKRHGPPDLLINNAAIINKNASLWNVSDAEFSDVMNVNVRGVVNVIRHFVPAMNSRGSGVIVNFSSGWGRSADAEVGPYCASKFAIEGLTRALALELPRGLAAIALNPGIIDTAMLQSCFGGSASSYESPESWARRAVPFLLRLGPADNGGSLTVPGKG